MSLLVFLWLCVVAVVPRKAVVDKVPEMLNIMFDVMTDAKLDSQQRVIEMLKESKVRADCVWEGFRSRGIASELWSKSSGVL